MDTTTSFNQEVFSADSYRELLEQIGQPLFLLKDAGVPTKNFIDWRHAGLWFDKGSEKRTWTRLNLEQYIWLKIVQQMRQLGFPTDLMLEVKNQLIPEVDIEDTMLRHQQLVIDNLDKMELDHDDKETLLKDIKSGKFLKDLQSTPEAKQFTTSQSLLKILLLRALSTRQQAAVLIYPDGMVTAWLDEMFLIHSSSPQLFQRTHLYISITELLTELLTDKQELIRPLRLLNHEEWQVLNALRDNTLEELKVSFQKDPRNKKVTKFLITTKDGSISWEDKAKITEILLNKRYSRVERKNRDGNKFHFDCDVTRKL